MFMPSFSKEIRYATRTLLKSPGYTAVALATLALGIGANTAIFSVVNQVLLNPAGVSNPERVVSVRVRYEKLALHNIGVSAPDYAEVLHSPRQFEAAALIQTADYNYTGSAVPERLRGANVSWRWFDVFGAKARLGRVFRPEEDRPNANSEIVLSFAAWKRLFGQDSGIVGHSVQLNGMPYRVIGVMGPDFRWPVDVDLWAPLGLPDDAFTEDNRFNESYGAMARLQPGLTFPQANAFVEMLGKRFRNSGTPNSGFAKDADWGMFLMPFADFIAGQTKTPMLVLLGAVGFVLLIACSNIAGLMLARASGRSREIAIRAALGAGRWNLIRQSLTESLVLAGGGALLGLGVAYAALKGLLALAPDGLPIAVAVRMDASVLLFTALAAAAAGVLFGVAPAWQISRLDRYTLLKEGGRSQTGGLARQRLRSALVVAEVALALMLLVGAGLFLRSLAAIQDVNPGFQSSGVITASVSLPQSVYGDQAKRIAFYRAVAGNLASLPGVTAASAAMPVPFSGGGGSASFAIEGRVLPPGDPAPHGEIGYVGPGYFNALGIPVRKGRAFTELDRENTEQVALVDEILARQYWPNEDPIGQHLRRGNRAQWATIVGVVGHVKNADLAGEDVKGRYYFPIYQVAPPMATFVARTPSSAARLASSMRQAVRAVDGTQPVAQIALLSDLVDRSLAPRRFVVTVMGVFAGMALLLAIVGLYGVIGYAVAQRTQELGVRMALGAQPGEILRLVLGQGMRLAGLGAAIGLAAALIAGALVRNQLFRVNAFDPLTFALTAAVLIAAALLASYIPARRATRVDPMVALRYE